jgi:hypothetical protein
VFTDIKPVPLDEPDVQAKVAEFFNSTLDDQQASRG